MSLKKLLVTEQQVTEEALERILSDYVLLAGDTRRAVLTAAGAHLPARAKVLLVLAAQHAWRFVAPGEEGDVSVPIKEIEKQTGLTGNTARPVLKALKDEHVVESPRAGIYRLPAFSLGHVEGEINGLRNEGTSGHSKRKR